MHLTASSLCILIAVICEIIAAIPPANTRISFMPLGIAFFFLSLIVGASTAVTT